jgi:predicted metal-dependent peptidase
MSNLEDRLSLVASKMTLREAFIAAVYAKLERKVVTKGTASTNGVWVKFATEFCDPLTDDELLGLCLHEAMHVVLMHPWRREGRNPALWNIANDAYINRTINDMGYELPAGGVDIPWVTANHSSEEIYARLQQEGYEPPPPEGQGEDGQGGDGGEGDGDTTGGDSGGGGWDGTGDLDDAPDQASEADIEATIVTAAKMAKACGNGGKLVDIVLGGGLQPKVSWSETLRHVMSAAIRDDYTYARHNKRYCAQGLYMPSLHSDGMGGMVIGVDTSGSMGQAELDQVAAEINAIFEDCRPEWVEVVYCDTSVANTERFYMGEPVELHAKGGGGTSFKPVFDYIEELGERVEVLVYFTDLCGSLDLQPPEYPVIWGTTYGRGDHRVPFGEVVEVTV